MLRRAFARRFFFSGNRRRFPGTVYIRQDPLERTAADPFDLQQFVNAPERPVFFPAPQDRRGAATGATAVVGGATYKVTNDAKATVIFAKGKKSAKNATVPASVTIKGKSYAVTGIGANAFKGAKAKTLVVRSKKLTKKSVKGSLKGSKVKVVKVKVGSKKVNKKYVKKYKKIFTKKICGKKVKVN